MVTILQSKLETIGWKIAILMKILEENGGENSTHALAQSRLAMSQKQSLSVTAPTSLGPCMCHSFIVSFNHFSVHSFT